MVVVALARTASYVAAGELCASNTLMAFVLQQPIPSAVRHCPHPQSATLSDCTHLRQARVVPIVVLREVYPGASWLVAYSEFGTRV